MEEEQPPDGQEPMDNVSEVQQPHRPVIVDKRKAEVWLNFDVERDEKTQKIIKST